MSVLIARLDTASDVIVSGPAVRAVAAHDRVVFLAGPAGAAAARLLPGVSDVITFEAPWVGLEPPAVDGDAIARLIADVALCSVDRALILTSHHQSPLPLALLLRQAGVPWIGATCVDDAGHLLDLRHPYRDDVHEVEQALSLATAAGSPLRPGGDRRLALRLPAATVTVPVDPYVVVHAGASVTARSLPATAAGDVVAALDAAGWNVVLTGSAGERGVADWLATRAAHGSPLVLAGQTDLAQLAHVIGGAAAVVCGNSAPAHLAAAMGTPAVVAFAPTVDPNRWRPWQVPHVLLGRFDISCAGCGTPRCPLPGQPCLQPFTAGSVLAAIDSIASDARHTVGAA